MSTITIFDNDRAVLWFHPEAGIVHHRFKTHMYGEAFRNVLDTGLDVLREHSATKWLSDDRHNSALNPDDSRWADDDWFPRCRAAGWQYWAIVLPEDVLGQMNMLQFISHTAKAGVTVRTFTTPTEALDWLESV